MNVLLLTIVVLVASVPGLRADDDDDVGDNDSMSDDVAEQLYEKVSKESGCRILSYIRTTDIGTVVKYGCQGKKNEFKANLKRYGCDYIKSKMSGYCSNIFFVAVCRFAKEVTSFCDEPVVNPFLCQHSLEKLSSRYKVSCDDYEDNCEQLYGMPWHRCVFRSSYRWNKRCKCERNRKLLKPYISCCTPATDPPTPPPTDPPTDPPTPPPTDPPTDPPTPPPTDPSTTPPTDPPTPPPTDPPTDPPTPPPTDPPTPPPTDPPTPSPTDPPTPPPTDPPTPPPTDPPTPPPTDPPTPPPTDPPTPSPTDPPTPPPTDPPTPLPVTIPGDFDNMCGATCVRKDMPELCQTAPESTGCIFTGARENQYDCCEI